MKLESILASSCRRRILRILSKHGRVNIMDLIRKVNSNYNQVNSNLLLLHNEGIIIDKSFTRRREIRLNNESLKTKRLLQVLKILDSAYS